MRVQSTRDLVPAKPLEENDGLYWGLFEFRQGAAPHIVQEEQVAGERLPTAELCEMVASIPSNQPALQANRAPLVVQSSFRKYHFLAFLFEILDAEARGFARPATLVIAAHQKQAIDRIPHGVRFDVAMCVASMMEGCEEHFKRGCRKLWVRLARAVRGGSSLLEGKLREVAAVMERYEVMAPSESEIDAAEVVSVEAFTSINNNLTGFGELIDLGRLQGEIGVAVRWARRRPPQFRGTKRMLLDCAYAVLSGRTLVIRYDEGERSAARLTAETLAQMHPKITVQPLHAPVAVDQVFRYSIVLLERSVSTGTLDPSFLATFDLADGQVNFSAPDDSCLLQDVAQSIGDSEVIGLKNETANLRAALVDVRRLLQRFARVARTVARAAGCASEGLIRGVWAGPTNRKLLPGDLPLLEYWMTMLYGEPEGRIFPIAGGLAGG